MALADWKPETWTAIYAAIVGTGALLLNFKTWLDSGVKLHLSLIPDGMVIGGGPELDERDLIMFTATNRGDAPTRVTSMVILKFPSLCARWRMRPSSSYAVTNPHLKGYPPNIPADIARAQQWTGYVRQRPDVIPDMHTGEYWVGIYTTYRNRPYLKRIPGRTQRIATTEDL